MVTGVEWNRGEGGLGVVVGVWGLGESCFWVLGGWIGRL